MALSADRFWGRAILWTRFVVAGLRAWWLPPTIVARLGGWSGVWLVWGVMFGWVRTWLGRRPTARRAWIPIARIIVVMARRWFMMAAVAFTVVIGRIKSVMTLHLLLRITAPDIARVNQTNLKGCIVDIMVLPIRQR